MFRSKGDEPKHKTTMNCLIAEAGMGDLLCSLPAINHIQLNCSWINLLVWCPDYLIAFFKHVLPKGTIVRGFTEAVKKYDGTKYGVTTKWEVQGVTRTTPMRTHPVIYSYGVLCDYFPTIEEMSYLKIRPDEIDTSKFGLPPKYAVLPAASTERVKTIPKETIDKLSDYIISKGYTPVYLGKTENDSGYEDMIYKADAQDYDFSKGINLLNKTNILESAAILAGAKLYIGIDSGLTHLAGFTDVPIVSYYSFVKAVQLVPIRDGIVAHNVYPIETKLACGGCQTKWIHLVKDFRDCYYDDYKCVSKEECSFEVFKEKIEKFNLL